MVASYKQRAYILFIVSKQNKILNSKRKKIKKQLLYIQLAHKTVVEKQLKQKANHLLRRFLTTLGRLLVQDFDNVYTLDMLYCIRKYTLQTIICTLRCTILYNVLVYI